jgi:nucleotidyltransferase/DNA polymerase involved in DNA repair
METYVYMIVFLFLPRFYVRPRDESRLVIVRDRLVLDMDEDAERAGVYRGMPVRQAQSIVQDGCFLPWKEEDYAEHCRLWLDVCTRFTGVIEPQDQHAAWLDLSMHPRPLELMSQIRQEIEAACGLQPRAGLAKAKWLARVAAEVGDDDYLALHYPQTFLAELPVTLLAPVAPEHRRRLSFLGYHSAKSVASVPLETLRAQFGEEAHSIQQASLGRGSAKVAAQYPPDALHESFRFPGTTDSLLVLEEGTAALARRIGHRLIEKERQGSYLRVVVELESGEEIARERTFTKPIRCPRTALAALKLLLDEPLQEPVAGLRVVLRELKRSVRSQLDLMGNGAAGERDHRVDSAFRYVRTVFGEEAVIQASQVQHPRRARVLREWKEGTGWV